MSRNMLEFLTRSGPLNEACDAATAAKVSGPGRVGAVVSIARRLIKIVSVSPSSSPSISVPDFVPAPVHAPAPILVSDSALIPILVSDSSGGGVGGDVGMASCRVTRCSLPAPSALIAATAAADVAAARVVRRLFVSPAQSQSS